MIVADNTLLPEVISQHRFEREVRISLSGEIFRKAHMVLKDHPCAVAVDDNDNVCGVLRRELSSYKHTYASSGEIDLWFLNRYECIFLYGCNEYSTILCREVLDHWTGKRLVLVGTEWELMMPFLPDLPEIECIWEDSLSEEIAAELSEDLHTMYIVTGIPYEEKMDRYFKGVMTYDEVMALTFLFSDRRRLGERYPDHRFFVIDAPYGNLGLLGMYYKAVSLAYYAKSRGYIPIIRIRNEMGALSIYQDFPGDDLWEKFYQQPEGYQLEEVMESRNVYFMPPMYNARILQTIMDERSEGTALSWPVGRYNNQVKEYIRERANRFLPYPDETLGVLIRGTDYAKGNLENHPKHAGKEMVSEKIDEMLEEGCCRYIFLATEDADYCRYFEERYKGRFFFTDQERYSTKEGEMLSEMFRNRTDKKEGFLIGVEYILVLWLLSRCRSLVASGDCTGLGEVRRMREMGNFEKEYVFQL